MKDDPAKIPRVSRLALTAEQIASFVRFGEYANAITAKQARHRLLARIEMRQAIKASTPPANQEPAGPPAPPPLAPRKPGQRHFLTQPELYHLERLYREGRTPREIAEILGITPGTAYNRIGQFRRADAARAKGKRSA